MGVMIPRRRGKTIRKYRRSVIEKEKTTVAGGNVIIFEDPGVKRTMLAQPPPKPRRMYRGGTNTGAADRLD